MDIELREALQDINSKLDKLVGLPDKVESLTDSFMKHVEEDKRFLVGDGENPGLVIRVDRLERSQASHQKFFWVLVTTVVGVIAEAVWRLIEHLKG